MRGDSIRDLYAKTAALAGLAVLAGIGALVDYWPVGVKPPAVVAINLPVADAARVIAPEAETIPVALVRVAAPRRSVESVPTLASLTTGAAFTPRATVALAPMPIPVPAYEQAPPLPPTTVVPVFEAVPSADPVPFVAGPDFDPSLVYHLSGDEDPGFLSDAVDMMKTTGSTIARGGAITGASIVTAFRAVSGAVKRLKFF